MTKTLKFVCYLDFSIISELERPFIKVIDGCCLRRVQPFRISNFGHWNLFVIWDLLFVILIIIDNMLGLKAMYLGVDWQ